MIEMPQTQTETPPQRCRGPFSTLDRVSLCYRLAKQRLPSFKDYAIHWVKGTLVYEKFWALTEVSFSVARGEVVGIVGRNGAGKSSLLKIVSGVLEPTTGKVHFDGRIAPILELGTGFDHELTGRENIFLNGLLLGRTRREIRERLDAIIEYSELGDFIESPIRSYSSGMLGRLGFSIAAAWTPGPADPRRGLRRRRRRLHEEVREDAVGLPRRRGDDPAGLALGADRPRDLHPRALARPRPPGRRRQARRSRRRLRPEHLRHRLTATREILGQAPVCGKLAPVPGVRPQPPRSAPPRIALRIPTARAPRAPPPPCPGTPGRAASRSPGRSRAARRRSPPSRPPRPRATGRRAPRASAARERRRRERAAKCTSLSIGKVIPWVAFSSVSGTGSMSATAIATAKARERR